MNRFILFLIAFLIGAILVFVSFEPLSRLMFSIREPYYKSPINQQWGKLTIRNDALGSGGFGSKRSGGRTHTGVDILSPIGTPVYAAKSGIAFRLKVPTGYGNYVMIYHPDGTQTIYAHLSEWKILPVQKVSRGQLIGLVGKTGNAASKRMEPHLHFEIRKNGVSLDPRGMVR